MRELVRLWLVACCAVWITAAKPAQAEDRLTLFAAASLGEALEQALQDFPADVRVSLGGSGAIARQIDQGAPADAVMLAHPLWSAWLDSRGLLLAGSRSAPLGNGLVIVGPSGARPLDRLTADTLTTRLGERGRLAMGEHRSVPAGQYAKAWLTEKGLWDTVQPRLAEVENVRAALALVSRGEVPLAIIYTSDLVAAPEASSPVWTPPPEEQPDIRYDLAATTEAGRALVAHLTAPAALNIFETFGFRLRSAP